MGDSYRQYVPNAAVSLERNTINVPNDDRYYLVHDHRVVGIFPSLKRAQVRFRELLSDLGYQAKSPEPAKVSAAQLAMERYLDAKEEYWATSHKFRSGGRLINR